MSVYIIIRWALDITTILFATFMYCYIPAMAPTSARNEMNDRDEDESGMQGGRQPKLPDEASDAELVYSPAPTLPSSSVSSTSSTGPASESHKSQTVDALEQLHHQPPVEAAVIDDASDTDSASDYQSVPEDDISYQFALEDAAAHMPHASPTDAGGLEADKGNGTGFEHSDLSDYYHHHHLVPQHHSKTNTPSCLPHSDDMVVQPPTPTSPSHLESYDLLDPYYSSSSDHSTNPLLHELRANRHNLILDSTHPETAPHIVITPPEYVWDETYTHVQNAVPYQWPCWLIVPPPNGVDWNTPMPPATDEPREDTGRQYVSCPVKPQQLAPLVFRHSTFLDYVESTATERLIFIHVVAAIQRRRCKASAIAASSRAVSFRVRYDRTPSIFSHIEKPFQWHDPAEPLIAASRYHRATLVLDSIMPFSVPHIIINGAPPQSPWVSWGNVVSDPQDCRFGGLLTVPHPAVSYINRLDPFDLEAAWEPDASVWSESDLDASDEISRPGSPLPETPLDAEGGYVTGSRFFCGDDDDDVYPMEKHGSLAHDGICSAPRPCEVIPEEPEYIEDDEDDLPPFDDWYKGIAERAQLAV